MKKKLEADGERSRNRKREMENMKNERLFEADQDKGNEIEI